MTRQDVIRELRNRGMTIKQIASLAGVGERQVYRWQKSNEGDNPSEESALRLSREAGVSPEEWWSPPPKRAEERADELERLRAATRALARHATWTQESLRDLALAQGREGALGEPPALDEAVGQ